MAAALADVGGEIVHIGPMEVEPLRVSLALSRIRRRFGLPPTLPMQSLAAARAFRRQLVEGVDRLRPDLVFSPVGSALLSDFDRPVPAVYSSDATFRLMEGYYPKYSNLARRAAREADLVEQRTITRADLIVYPTEWAARSAIEHYGADPEKVHVVPYGANVDPPERSRAVSDRPSGPLRLLFVGVDWERKGGEIALNAAETLNRRGIDTVLTVVGCVPPLVHTQSWLTVVPFLDKNDPEARREMAEHYLSSDLFVLPTRQECYGIVFCEAAAYGLPVIATDTGGVSGVVRHGHTGQLLPLEADGQEYADAIERMLGAPGGLAAARLRARAEFDRMLNWAAWAERVYPLMHDLVVR